LDHLVEDVSQVGSHLLLTALGYDSNAVEPYQSLSWIGMYHQLSAHFYANVEYILRIEAVSDAVQNTHRILLRFATAVLLLSLLQCREVVRCLNDGVDGVFLLEVLPAVGHNGFDDVEPNFTGVETDCLHP
jgi:hypothetical protein